MGQLNDYDKNRLASALQDANNIKTELDSVSQKLDEFSFKEKRLDDYYDEYISGLKSASKDLYNESEVTMGKEYIPWFQDLLVELGIVDKDTLQLVEDIAITTPDSEINPPTNTIINPTTEVVGTPPETTIAPPTYTTTNPTTDTNTPTATAPIITPVDAIIDVDQNQNEEIDSTFDATVNEVQSTDPKDQYKIEKDKWNLLPTALQTAIIAQLRKIGYTDDEINDIINGKRGIPKVVLNKIGVAIKDVSTTNPEIREEIKDKYGIDIFNEDGKIIPAALASLLMMDLKTTDEGEKVAAFISEQYGVTINDNNQLLSYKYELEQLYKTNPSIRKDIIEQYGIDVFNDDGTVNKDVLSSLMSFKDTNVKHDIASILKDKYGITIVEDNPLATYKSELEQLYQTNPNIRQELIEKYGVDVFNKDGTINESVLSDILNNSDSHNNLNSLLRDRYNINIVGDDPLISYKSTLENLYRTNPSVRNDFIEKYGVDVFNNDGTVNETALSNLIERESFNSKPDIVELLTDKYGITLVDNNLLTSYETQLEALYKTNPSIREDILNKYGIDIFNKDGTINKSKLTLAMIMDDADKNGNFDLSNLLKTLEPEKTPVPTPTEELIPTPTEEIVPPTEVTPTPTVTIEPEENIHSVVDNPPNVEPTTPVIITSSPIISSVTPISSVPTPTTTQEIPTSTPTPSVEGLEDQDDVISKITSSNNQIATVTATPTVQNAKQSSSGIATIAGIGAAIAAAGAGAMLAKKKNENNDEVEELEDYNSDDENAPIDIDPQDREGDWTELDGDNTKEEYQAISKGSTEENEVPKGKDFLDELEIDNDDKEKEEENNIDLSIENDKDEDLLLEDY